MFVKYKRILRGLQETETRHVKCNKLYLENKNIIRYNCSMETNGWEIENIKINPNLKEFNFDSQDVEIIGVNPDNIILMDILQNAIDKKDFNKKIFILDQSIISIDYINN